MSVLHSQGPSLHLRMRKVSQKQELKGLILCHLFKGRHKNNRHLLGNRPTAVANGCHQSHGTIFYHVRLETLPSLYTSFSLSVTIEHQNFCLKTILITIQIINELKHSVSKSLPLPHPSPSPPEQEILHLQVLPAWEDAA